MGRAPGAQSAAPGRPERCDEAARLTSGRTIETLELVRTLGPVGAIGIVCAVLSTLTFLPGVLVLPGRAAYWPAKIGRTAEDGAGHGIWKTVAGLVDRAPRKVWALAGLLRSVLMPLLALGVDYNIFLMTRVREESLRHGARQEPSHAPALLRAGALVRGVVAGQVVCSDESP